MKKNFLKLIKILLRVLLTIVVILGWLFMLISLSEGLFSQAAKPVIYFYPEEEMEINVTLDYDGELDYTYPKYNDGWEIIAKPDGTIIHNDNEYSYLFWEGTSETTYDLTKGFVVKGEDTVEFLQDKLSYLGLTPKEYNEFIVYWLPFMEKNNYNLITFQEDIYTQSAKLSITPTPDNIQRIFMVFKPLSKHVDIESTNLRTI